MPPSTRAAQTSTLYFLLGLCTSKHQHNKLLPLTPCARRVRNSCIVGQTCCAQQRRRGPLGADLPPVVKHALCCAEACAVGRGPQDEALPQLQQRHNKRQRPAAAPANSISELASLAHGTGSRLPRLKLTGIQRATALCGGVLPGACMSVCAHEALARPLSKVQHVLLHLPPPLPRRDIPLPRRTHHLLPAAPLRAARRAVCQACGAAPGPDVPGIYVCSPAHSDCCCPTLCQAGLVQVRQKSVATAAAGAHIGAPRT